MKERVIIGLSGGVDSSIAAWLLKERGYRVSALFMRNWNDATGLLSSECHWEDDFMLAEMVASRLKIPFHFVDLSEQYRKRVIDYMFSEYEKGRTPNPDILCNREIKFDAFAVAAEELGADFIATGHYCRKDSMLVNGQPVYRLLAGMDKNKDQSYFLCQLNQGQLGKALFPLGELTKPEVRNIASSLGLPTAERKDSQGICFIGKVDLPAFLQQKLEPRKGDVVEIVTGTVSPVHINGLPDNDISDELLKIICAPFIFSRHDGMIIGTHNGAHYYTVGQRKGLSIGGHREPLFVLGTDTASNIIFVGEGHNHPALNRKGLYIKTGDIHYVRPDLEVKPGEICDYMVRIRYRQPLQEARLFRRADGIYIVFNTLQRGITPGQFAAWYDGDELIGSGIING